MTTSMTVGSTADFEQALKVRAELLVLRPPEGKSVSDFVSELVVFGTTSEHLAGFDAYEIEAIVRSVASLH